MTTVGHSIRETHSQQGEFWRGRRVLITGNTGFKGAWLSLWLQGLGATVTGYSLSAPTDPSLFNLAGLGESMDCVTADLRDLSRLQRAVCDAQPELIFHLGAQAVVRQSYDDPVETFETNVMGTVHVLEAARKADSVCGVIVVTSDKCYENRGQEQAYRETDALGGHDPYSCSKACAELVASAYRRSFFADGPAIATVRAGNVIGGGDWATDRLIPDCMRALLNGRSIHIRNPHAVRPWQHVLEPLGGYLAVARRLLLGDDSISTEFNFGPQHQDARPVRWIVEQLTALWGEDATWNADEGKHPHEAHYLTVDSSRAHSELGWKPRLGLGTALEWTVAWFRAYAAEMDMRQITLQQIQDYERLECLHGGNDVPLLRVA